MEKQINVISLFDGISAGRVALERAGFKIGNYYASEVDKYAIQVAQKNHPDTVQLGDVRRVTRSMFREDFLAENPIDLVIGGSPCQAFSVAGHQKGFEDDRGQLFWEFVRVLEEFKPRYFLLENVKMKPEHQQVITDALGVEPIEVNSACVSAQNRKRLYWTNIPFVGDLSDRGIVLRDVLDAEGFVDRDKSFCLDANYWKGGNLKQYFEKHRRQLVFTSCEQVGVADGINGHDLIKRVYSVAAKAPTLNACTGDNREPKIATSSLTYRKLTPTECERLQTFPDGYTEGVSNTQRYKALGNSWTVDVIVELVRGAK